MLTLSDEQIQRAAQDGLREVVRTTLANGYSYSDRFKKVILASAESLEPEIQTAVKRHMREALMSPAFGAAVQDALVKAAADKFGGAFKGIMIAVARRAADDPEVREAMIRAGTVAAIKKTAP